MLFVKIIACSGCSARAIALQRALSPSSARCRPPARAIARHRPPARAVARHRPPAPWPEILGLARDSANYDTLTLRNTREHARTLGNTREH